MNIDASTRSAHQEYVASPSLVGDYAVTSPKGTVHVIGFYSQEFEDYFVAWGSFAAPLDGDGFNEGLWCRVWTLSQLFELFDDVQTSPRENVDIEDVVREVVSMKTADSFTPREQKFPTEGEIILSDSTSIKLKIKTFVTKISFIGRAAFQLNVIAETQDEAHPIESALLHQGDDGSEHVLVAKLFDVDESDTAPYLEMPLFDMTGRA
ncbi:HET domain containing [Pyrenophora seminiperda CCB06]|uniref:HET domain containing n=1 Tax=Pyrenophora seminiperda CCB06 TaxID=1302712 RepID=A0A3M7M8M5_9PLEO|nr:HET domain containing [Pyrenophora seminiperda CCB06]